MSESGIELKPLGEAAGGKNILVPGGETIIGRGQFLQVADKRVSRKHGLLEVKNGKVFLTPTHMNPCFFRTSGSPDQVTLPKDLPHPLENGDHFGLLPDSLFFEVVISSPAKPNGNLNSEESKPTEECIKKKTSSEKVDEDKNEDSGAKSSVAEEKFNPSPVKQPKPSSTKAPEIPKPAPTLSSSTTSPEKKRNLPNWMVAAANSVPPAGNVKKKKPVAKPVRPSKGKSSSDYASDEEITHRQKTPRKGKAVDEAPKKQAETRPLLSGSEEESDEPRNNGKKQGKSKRSETPSEEEMSEEEYKPKAKGRGRQQLSPSEEEESSEEEYKPQGKRRAPSKRNRSLASDDDSDDEYSPRAKSKKKSKARTIRVTPKRKQPARRKKYNESEESEEGDDSSPRKRPSRLAKTKRASYVDDFVVDDFSEESEEIPVKTSKEDQDSDFVAEEEESGSDWAADNRSSQKSPSKRSRGRPQAPRRASRNTSRRKPSDSEEEQSESEEEYTPRPSKRRQLSKTESNKKNKHRKPCPFGKKCYRKNPAHFQDVAHPGDDSYDEGSEEEEEGSGSELEDKPECEHGTDCYRKSAEHLRKFKHTKKPKKKEHGKSEKDKKSVLAGDSDDDGEPNTYNYDDSFISKTLPSGSEESSQEGAGDDDISDDEEENVKDLVKEAKGFLKNKKMGKPLSSK